MSVGVLFTSVSSKFAFDGRAVFEQAFQLSTHIDLGYCIQHISCFILSKYVK